MKAQHPRQSFIPPIESAQKKSKIAKLLGLFGLAFQKQLEGDDSPKTIAKQRLLSVLQNDRMNISPGKMDELRHRIYNDLVQLISKYGEIDMDKPDFKIDLLTDSHGKMQFVSNILINRIHQDKSN